MSRTIVYGSVCSGIEAATAAWHPLGWEPSFFSEIDAFPRAVLAHHYPRVPLHGDFTTIEAGQYRPIDLLVGGTPCQSFSVAGLRGGLDDDRGNLALEYLRLAQRLRPKWLVWENVPGVLSSGGGRDFGAILGGLVELGYGFAYRVLDAQFFGVAQRRRRVFVVGYLGDWRRAAAVLFERHSLSGDSAPCREARKDLAPTISARPSGGGGLGTDFDLDGGCVITAPTLRAGGNKTVGDRPYGTDVDTCDSLVIGGGVLRLQCASTLGAWARKTLTSCLTWRTRWAGTAVRKTPSPSLCEVGLMALSSKFTRMVHRLAHCGPALADQAGTTFQRKPCDGLPPESVSVFRGSLTILPPSLGAASQPISALTDPDTRRWATAWLFR